MATYVISDIHGEYDMFKKLLHKINLKDDDTLYILGDVIDRGPHPVRTLLALMEMPNAVCLAGNHELMALDCLEFLMQEITDASIAQLDSNTLSRVLGWQRNGSRTTLDEFRTLDRKTQLSVIDFMQSFLVYENITVNDTDYLLVHAGLGNFSPEKGMNEYSLQELLWDRADYDKQYFDDKYVVTGHTPTQYIDKNPRPGFIYKNKNHIAIDCGAFREDGQLAAICPDTGEEFYVKHSV